jgi:hypothetical protein
MDELTQLLLSRVAGGSNTTEISVADVVEQSLGDDPLAGPLAAALRQREAAAAGQEQSEPAGGSDDDAEVADVIQRLYAEVEMLRGRNRLVSDALGACPRCFGEDELCPVCRGRGRPGGRQPNPALFAELVEPAVRRVRGFAANVLPATGDEVPRS